MEVKNFPRLYTLTKTKSSQYWDVSVQEENDGTATIITEYGKLGGKAIINKKKISEGKSKKTPFLQAKFDAESSWKEKKDKKGYVEDLKLLTNTTNQLMNTQPASAQPAPAQPALAIAQTEPTPPAKTIIKKKQNAQSESAQPAQPASAQKTEKQTPEKKQITQKNQTAKEPQVSKEVQKAKEPTDAQLYSQYASFKFLPMLANKFLERKSHIKYPCYAQDKLDGVRCSARMTSSVDVLLKSRNDREFPFFEHIKQAIAKVGLEIAIILDGELYSKKIPFRTLNGHCNRKKKEGKSGYLNIPKDELDSIHFYIFDCYFILEPNKPFDERLKYLKDLLKNADESLKLVNGRILNSESEVKPFHDQSVQDGHEGAMIRNLKSAYRLKDRSNDLLKYKEFQDEEFEIVGAEASTNGKEGPIGDMPGCIIWKLKVPDTDLTFTCRPRDTHDSRRIDMKAYLTDPKAFIGLKYTVRFQEKYDNGQPRFPVGIAIRYDLD